MIWTTSFTATDWPSKLLDAYSVLTRIVDSSNHIKLEIKSESPSNISRSCVNYVDMSGKCIQDITRDGTGNYKNDGKFHWSYKRMANSFTNVRSKHRSNSNRCELAHDEYRVVKIYYKRKADPVVNRYIMYVETARQEFYNNLVVVGYIFRGDEQLLKPMRHGNAKKNPNSSTRIKPSAINNVKTLTQTMSVTKAIETHIEQHGGRDNIAPESRPSKHHIYRAHTKVNDSDSQDDFDICYDVCERKLWIGEEDWIVSGTLCDIGRRSTDSGSAALLHRFVTTQIFGDALRNVG